MTKISKYLSKHLRHTPEALGLSLQPGGWVEVSALLSGCARSGFPISPAELREVVETNDKQRFAFDESATRIRANQGHSTEVDLQLRPQTPPEVLYHGTAEHALDSILASGLRRMDRHHVHLSPTIPAARKVGARHGAPVVLAVAMHAAGILFYCSDNGVWLVDGVGPAYLRQT
jgi:putative RNA 2'-phosphotransferase